MAEYIHSALLFFSIDGFIFTEYIELAKDLFLVVATSTLLYLLLKNKIKTMSTATTQAEQKTQLIEGKLEAALESMSDAVFISDSEGRFIHFNEAFATFHRFKNKAECAKTLDEYPRFLNVYSSNGELLPLERWAVPRALRGETGKNMEFALQHKDTDERWIGSYNFAPILNSDGVIIGSVVTGRDITEQKQKETLLAASEASYRSLYENIPLGLAYCKMLYEQGTAQDFVYLEVNPAFEKLTGLKNVAGKKVSEVIPGIYQADPDLFERYDRVASTAKQERFEIFVEALKQWFSVSAYSPEKGYFIAVFDVITERKMMEVSLAASEKEFRLLAESMPQIVWITTPDGRNIYCNQQWCDYTGLSLEESYGHGWNKPFHPDDQKRAWDAWQNAIDNNATYSLESQLRRADGVYRWWLIRGVPVFDKNGKIYKWFSTCTDIHDIKETEKALRDSESRLQFTLQTSHIGGWDVNLADYSSYRTLEHAHIFGYKSHLLEWSFPIFLNHVIPNDRDTVDRLIKNAITNQSNFDFECRICRADGEIRWIWAAGKYLPNEKEGTPHIAGIVQDITERKKAEETIYELAFYDPLTRLPNRRLMLDRLKQILVSRSIKSRYGAVLLINLDNFRFLNDSKGHRTGDSLLVSVTKHLQAVVHEDDTVARIGGDEFVALLDGLDSAADLAAARATSVAKRIIDAIRQPFDLEGYEYRCSASIGISLFCGNHLTVDELMKQADIAMHQAKKSGCNTISFFDSEIQLALEARVQLATSMYKALNDQYRLYYQIQVNDKGKATGAEALIRWHHPEHGIISPADFIPLAEETELILTIGQWVLETACTQLKIWEQDKNTQHLILAVNVSAKQFSQSNFVEQVLAVLEKTRAAPDKLKLELTESMLVNNIKDIIGKMNKLKAKGLKFSLDDFGTGFSSLAYLKSLPLYQLKIDQSFVRDALTDKSDAAIVHAIIKLGESLDMEIIAEGVETEAQRNFLASQGCNHYQGYLFSKPLPLAEFEQLLRDI